MKRRDEERKRAVQEEIEYRRIESAVSNFFILIQQVYFLRKFMRRGC